VQKEIKSHSDVVANSRTETRTIQSQDSLRRAVKSAIKEDDCSRSLVIFGLEEDDQERIDSKVTTMFSEL
jgi:hypothetical protein